MQPNKHIHAIIIAVVCLFHGPAIAMEKINVASEGWENATLPNGKGVFFEILRQVYEPEGYQLNFKLMPYKRSVLLTKNSQNDIWVGSYKDEVEGVIYPKLHFDVDIVEALCLQKLPAPADISTLKGMRLGWILGYDYHKYLPYIPDYRDVSNRNELYKLLESGQIDCLLEPKTEIDHNQKKFQKTLQHTHRYTMMYLPLYYGFSPTPKGQKLADIFDRQFPKLYQSGALATLYKKWDYPFYGEQLQQIMPNLR